MKKIKYVALSLLLSFIFSTSNYAASYVMHTVNQGDTYYNVASKYSVDMNGLMSLNTATDSNIKEGQLLKVMPLQQGKTILVNVNGTLITPDAQPYIENDRTFVPIRFVADALSVDKIDWNQETKTAIIEHNGKEIKLPIGSNNAYVDGTKQEIDAQIQLYEDRTFVPLRFVSETLGSTVEWDQSSYTVTITQNGSPIITPYSEDDLYWLSRLVEAESKGEPYEGKLAVANVIITRKKSYSFPNTIKGVIFDTTFGIQFTPIKNGHIYNTPSPESISAAKEALSGNNNIGNSLYFVNPTKSPGSWIEKNRTFYKKINNHAFYL